MSAAQLMTDLARLGIQLEAHGDRLRYSPRSAVTPELAAQMKAHKPELLARLRPDTTDAADELLDELPRRGCLLWLDDDGRLQGDIPADLADAVARLEAELSRVNDSLEQEVAERRRAEAALRESEAFSQSLVESLPLNVFRKDLDGRITFVNQRYCQNLGLTSAELMGKTDYDLFPDQLAEKYVADDKRVIESGETLEDIEEHQKPDGQMTYVHVLKVPVRNDDGETLGTQGMFWDVTPRYEAEAAQLPLAVHLIGAAAEHLADVVQGNPTPTN